jgi:TRAP-type C4-dicarboxylate transport system permease small subunit
MSSGRDHTPLGPLWRWVARLVLALTALSCLALLAMVAIVCGDVALRVCGHAVKGAYDVVRVAGAICVACALPLTTAMKGHVAIEFFFQKLGRAGRLAVDSLMRLIMIAVFVFAAFECVGYGQRFLRNGEVTSTIELPIFWVPWVMAAAFAASALVVAFHLVHPERELLKL